MVLVRVCGGSVPSSTTAALQGAAMVGTSVGGQSGVLLREGETVHEGAMTTSRRPSTFSSSHGAVTAKRVLVVNLPRRELSNGGVRGVAVMVVRPWLGVVVDLGRRRRNRDFFTVHVHGCDGRRRRFGPLRRGRVPGQRRRRLERIRILRGLIVVAVDRGRRLLRLKEPTGLVQVFGLSFVQRWRVGRTALNRERRRFFEPVLALLRVHVGAVPLLGRPR